MILIQASVEGRTVVEPDTNSNERSGGVFINTRVLEGTGSSVETENVRVSVTPDSLEP